MRHRSFKLRTKYIAKSNLISFKNLIMLSKNGTTLVFIQIFVFGVPFMLIM